MFSREKVLKQLSDTQAFIIPFVKKQYNNSSTEINSALHDIFGQNQELIDLAHNLFKDDFSSRVNQEDDQKINQYDLLLTCFTLKLKSNILQSVKDYDMLIQLPLSVIHAILCKPNPQFERFITSAEQLIQLFELIPSPSLCFEMLVESINLKWFMALIKNTNDLLPILKPMSGEYQILFLNCLDNQWLAELVENANDFNGYDYNNFLSLYQYREKELEFLNPKSSSREKPLYFMPPILQGLTNEDKSKSILGNYLLHRLNHFSINLSDISHVKSRNQSITNEASINWKKAGLFALGVTGAVIVSGTILNRLKFK